MPDIPIIFSYKRVAPDAFVEAYWTLRITELLNAPLSIVNLLIPISASNLYLIFGSRENTARRWGAVIRVYIAYSGVLQNPSVSVKPYSYSGLL